MSKELFIDIALGGTYMSAGMTILYIALIVLSCLRDFKTHIKPIFSSSKKFIAIKGE